MALISNAKGRGEDETPSGYERLFGNRQLGMLISKVQATVISTGNELEKILASRLKKTDGISIQNINKEKRIFKNVKRGHTIKVDCVVEEGNDIRLIEIKDGDTFDTKKVAGEVESLEMVREYLKKKEPDKWNFKDLVIYKFNKGNIVPSNKRFNDLIEKNPLSWAMTSTLAIEYTLEEPAKLQ